MQQNEMQPENKLAPAAVVREGGEAPTDAQLVPAAQAGGTAERSAKRRRLTKLKDRACQPAAAPSAAVPAAAQAVQVQPAAEPATGALGGAGWRT